MTLRIFSVKIRMAPVFIEQQIFELFHFGLRGFPSKILVEGTHGGAHCQQPVMDTDMGGVLEVQLVGCQVGRNGQRPVAVVLAAKDADPVILMCKASYEEI